MDRENHRGDILLSSLLVTNSHSFNKSLLGGLIMLWRPPILSIKLFPTLSYPKQSGMYSRRMTFVVLSRKNIPFSKRLINLNTLNGQDTMKTGQWRMGKASYGQMRPK